MEDLKKSVLIKGDNIIGFTGRGVIPMTQEEFNALPPEKQLNGSYYITDGTDEIVVSDNEISDGKLWSSQKIASELKTSSNKEPTELVFNGDSTYFGLGAGNNKYEVKNGICYFQVYIQTKGTTTSTMVNVVTGLPKPKFMRNFNVTPYVWTNNTYTPLLACINEGGTLQACKGGAWYSYFINGSYPIA